VRGGRDEAEKEERIMVAQRMSARMIAATVVVGLAATAAFAELNFKSGPAFTASPGFTFNLTGEASGQGNTRMVATIVISATVDYTCRNRGGNEVAAQSPVNLTQTVSDDIRSDHNGRSFVDLTATLQVAATVAGKEIGCPNGNWTGVNPVIRSGVTATASITFGGATVFSGGPLAGIP
jgi:hypothetical protein